MNEMNLITKVSELLAEGPVCTERFPSVEAISEIMQLVRAVVFPGFFDVDAVAVAAMRPHVISVNLDRIYQLLREQISRAGVSQADATALAFIDSLPEIRRMLQTDVDAIFANDPAVDNRNEVIFCYPGVLAMVHYRTAHALLQLGVPVIPRIITEMAHSATGIDIHPGAEIGEYFAIDHGTGIVIGQTCIIGRHVTLYQGVTLGSKNFTLNDDGHPMNIARHPIIEDNVTIYSNASVLGRITIGHDAVIGGNLWVTTDVPPHGRVVQNKS